MPADASAETLLSWMTWATWALVGLCALAYFASSYLFEILAQKQQEPRWMAWVPIANGLLMLRLVGWGRWFWVILGGYLLALLGMLLPGSLRIVGMVAVVPLALGMVALSLAYFPVLATKRGLSVGVGLWVVVPQFVPPFVEASMPGAGVWVAAAASVAACMAFLWIVFHDGGPLHGPHPVGYALTLVSVIGFGLALQALPSRLAHLAAAEGLPDELSEAFAQLGFEAGPVALPALAPADAIGRPGADPLRAAGIRAGSGAEALPVRIPDTCPPDARERSEAQGAGRAWWCEVPVDGRWVRHGPARTWHDNGYLESEGRYDHGRRTGTWTRYWRSGGRRVQAEFVDDVQHGWMHRWDAFGKPEAAVRFEDGAVAAGS